MNKAELYRRLGREYTTEEFDELCFDYGLELDEDVSLAKVLGKCHPLGYWVR